MGYKFSDYTDHLQRTINLINDAKAELARVDAKIAQTARDAEARGVWVEVDALRSKNEKWLELQNTIASLEDARKAQNVQINSAEVQAIRQMEENEANQRAIGAARLEALKARTLKAYTAQGLDPATFESAWTFTYRDEVIKRAVLDDIFGPDDAANKRLNEGEVI